MADVETPIINKAVRPVSSDAHGHENHSNSYSFGATPDLRKTWTTKRNIDEILEETKVGLLKDSPKSTAKRTTYRSLETQGAAEPTVQHDSSFATTVKDTALAALAGFPGLVIAVLMNLFFGVSFGQAFFPNSWEFPPEVPRAIGVQMFLVATVIGQIVMTYMSSFPMAFGMMMVENVPFFHIISNIAIAEQGMGKETFATVFVALALGSLLCGAFFYLLGHLELGNIVYFFPRHVIVGCIGGIGVFLFLTGMEGSTNKSWEWDFNIISGFFTPAVLPLWLLSLGFEISLRVLSHVTKYSLLPPFFFMAIPPTFYIILLITGIPIETAHENGWFFQGVKGVADPLLIWKLLDLRLVNWYAIFKAVPTIIAMTIFSLMHVPINIPSLSISTNYPADMNKELKAHGVSNILSGLVGGLQNYLCYCNSVTYYKCNGGGKISGLLLAAACSVFYFIGPSAVFYVPRCMAGCLLMHIGSDLTKEALWDSLEGFDSFEYGSVVAITIVMTAYGMTAGLAAGVFCAALTFTLQTGSNVPPIRTIRSASLLRSSRWRSPGTASILDVYSRTITVVQLQGHLFFGNATILSEQIRGLLENSKDLGDIKIIILDFTLVLRIDSSAADTIAKIFDICSLYGVKVCYSRGSKKGFPTVSPLTEQLHKKSGLFKSNSVTTHKSGFSEKSYQSVKSTDPLEDTFSESKVVPQQGADAAPSASVLSLQMNVTDSLDEALAWSEDVIIDQVSPSAPKDVLKDDPKVRNRPAYLRHLHALCPNEPSLNVDKLFSYFQEEFFQAGTRLWKEGDESDRAVLLVQGSVISTFKDDEGARENISIGHLVGEYGLINNLRRQGSLMVVDASVLYVLHKHEYDNMIKREPHLALILSRICMAYLGHRVMHVSNRIWESRCLPV